ncbi:ISPsy2, transposase [Pseudomonas syringae pv. berberidis]|nr:ISPsy2, transposase [Pseudomonas syringae pv. berberidis]
MDDKLSLLHSVEIIAANATDVTQLDKLLHGSEHMVCADAGYARIEKWSARGERQVNWQAAA